jgi:hypothetical protein
MSLICLFPWEFPVSYEMNCQIEVGKVHGTDLCKQNTFLYSPFVAHWVVNATIVLFLVVFACPVQLVVAAQFKV